MATLTTRVSSTANAMFSRYLGSWFFLFIGAGLGLAIIYKLPRFFKNVSTSKHGKYGYMFKRPKGHDDPVSPSPPMEDTGTVFGSSGTKRLEWFIRRTLTTQVPVTNGLSVGKLLVLLIYLALSGAFSYYRNSDPKTFISLSNHQRFGHLSISQLPIVFALSMKNSPLGFLIGEGYEKLNFLHRITGRLMCLFGVIHGGLALKSHYDKKAPLYKTCDIYGTVALGSMLLMGFMGWRAIRLHIYQFFLVIHMIGSTIVLAALHQHVPVKRPYIYASIAILFLDAIISIFKTRITKATISAMPGGLTRVQVHGVSDGWRAGQHVFIRVLNGRNIFEKHPFTIANAPCHASLPKSDKELVLYIKAAGDFTRRLHNLAGSGDFELAEKRQVIPQAKVRVQVEGPYGASFENFAEYDTVFLCAGGSGFSYAIGLIEEIVGKALRGDAIVTRHIELIWVFRDIQYVEAYAESITAVVRVVSENLQHLAVRIRLFMSSESEKASNPMKDLGADFRNGRPDIPELLAGTIAHSNSLIVGVCGPTSLVKAVQSATRGVQVGGLTRIAVHSESFGW